MLNFKISRAWASFQQLGQTVILIILKNLFDDLTRLILMLTTTTSHLILIRVTMAVSSVRFKCHDAGVKELKMDKIKLDIFRSKSFENDFKRCREREREKLNALKSCDFAKFDVKKTFLNVSK